MPTIDPYDDIYERMLADDYREIHQIEDAARKMAKRLGLAYRSDPQKIAAFVAAGRKRIGV